jgi:hypothetical protein
LALDHELLVRIAVNGLAVKDLCLVELTLRKAVVPSLKYPSDLRTGGKLIDCCIQTVRASSTFAP